MKYYCMDTFNLTEYCLLGSLVAYMKGKDINMYQIRVQ